MPAIVECSHCHKELEWTPTDAGHTVRCACGAAVPIPLKAPGEPDDYDLVPEPAAVVRRRVAPKPVLDVNAPPPTPTLAYRAPKEEPRTADERTLKDLWIPLWLLGAGVLISVVAALIRHQPLFKALTSVGVQIGIGTVLMTLALLIAAKARGIKLGAIQVAMFKLAAVSVAPGALVALFGPFLEHIPLGGLIGLLAEFAFFFALLGVLFDLDESDTWYCVFVMFLVQVAAYFLLPWMMGR